MYEKAKNFATTAHSGMTRKGSNEPYINHPLEVAQIVQTMSEDQDVWAAALLHDTVEDTPVTIQDIQKEFGAKIAQLVAADTENKRENLPPDQTWKIRKEETIDFLKNKATIDEKKIVIADKLSNIRQLNRDYKNLGEQVWQRFNQKNKSEHAWYYRSILGATKELSQYQAWQEYQSLVEDTFGPQDQPTTSPSVQPKNRKIQPKTIVTSFLAIIVLTLAGFIVYKTLFNNNLSPKSFSQFDHIIKGVGYEKVENEVAEYSDSRGGYVTYIKQDETMADGMAMFYNVESKEYLKELVNSSIGEDYDLATLFEDFDWSKNYNKKEKCSKNNAQTYICINTVQVENTLLFVLYHSNSEDKVHSEIDNVISAMGYNQR